MKENILYKGFFPRLFEYISESRQMDLYYERKFGIPAENFYYINKETENVVSYVKGIPIIKNPKSFKGFDPGIRIIIDKNANIYVAKYDGDFNHGIMANALLQRGIINTLKYNERAKTYQDVKGIYADQKNFILAIRLMNTNKIVQSDIFEWEKTEARKIIEKIKLKHPQFQIHLRYKTKN